MKFTHKKELLLFPTRLIFLEKTYFIKLISSYSKSIDREISGRKKIYVCDTGIANYFGKPDEGKLLENAILNNLKDYGEVKYYERRTGGEVDFLLPDKKIALEIKQKGNGPDYAQLKKISKDINFSECYVITKKFVDEKGFVLASDV